MKRCFNKTWITWLFFSRLWVFNYSRMVVGPYIKAQSSFFLLPLWFFFFMPYFWAYERKLKFNHFLMEVESGKGSANSTFFIKIINCWKQQRCEVSAFIFLLPFLFTEIGKVKSWKMVPSLTKKVLVLLAIESRYFDVNIVRFVCNSHLTKQNFKEASSLIQAHWAMTNFSFLTRWLRSFDKNNRYHSEII